MPDSSGIALLGFIIIIEGFSLWAIVYLLIPAVNRRRHRHRR